MHLEREREAVLRRYRDVRAKTTALAAPLSAEDMTIQSMPDASPTKWHLAHTTWFFEQFVLARFEPSHQWRDVRWRVLFNSYYEAAGPRHPRTARGLLSRPALDEIRAWRATIDEQMGTFIAAAGAEALAATLLGTHHEEQHQELLLTDVKHALAGNPLRPNYAPDGPRESCGQVALAPLGWTSYDEQVALIGHDGDGFAFDNERPRHRAIVGPFSMASRLVTNGEYAQFVEDNGYGRPDLWLSDGWATLESEKWSAPLYWERERGATTAHACRVFTLRGLKLLDEEEPVTHVSFYEADAYARWAGCRLPTEEEWETVAAGQRVDGNFLDSGRLLPSAAPPEGVSHVSQLFGDAWEWTASAYLPYPRFQPLSGALGEYNGKFMSGQMVLRGGSCISPQSHLRPTYRNYFPPHARWQVSGIRLARDA